MAIGLLEDVLPLDRRDGMLHKMLGAAYAGIQNTQKATLHLKRAAELGYDDPDTLLSLASIHKDTGDTRGSLRIVEKLIAREPNEPRASRFKAFLLRSMGEAQKALDWIDASREKLGVHPETTILRAELLTRFKRHEEAERALSALEADASILDGYRRDANFALGKVFDETARYDEAFEAIRKANHMLDRTEVVAPDLFRARWTVEAIAGIPTPAPTEAPASARPVFIIGMPRSGTTLTEQILAAHPEVESVGESGALNTLCRDLTPAHLTEETLTTVAETYLAETDPAAPASAPVNGKGKAKGKSSTRHKKPRRPSRVIDKMPENYYFVQIIARALPNARVVHCTRDLRDVALSCFFQNFGSRLAWTRRLETHADQNRLYRSEMALSSETHATEILESNYETLTSDPRPNVEAMLAHIGLPFDETCMAHHKQKSTVHTASVDQVRNPIYTSSQQRWRRYEQHLAPLIDAIGN